MANIEPTLNILCAVFKVAGSLLLDLNAEGVQASPVDVDDRRSVFQIVSPTNKK